MGGTDKRTGTLLVGAALATAAFAGYLAAGLPLGIPNEWVWRRNSLPVSLVPSSVAALLFLALVWHLLHLDWAEMRSKEREPWLFLLVLMIFLLQLALVNSVGAPWISPGSIIISPNATTYFALSMNMKDVHSWVAGYHDTMASLPYHARTHPPGLTLFFYGVRRLMAFLIPEQMLPFSTYAQEYRVFGLGPSSADAAAAVFSAFLIALIGALSIVPIYLLSKELMPPRSALRVAMLTGGLPALLLLSASPDVILLTLVAVTLWLSYLAWRTLRTSLAFLAGLVFAVSTFVSLGVLAVSLWLALWAMAAALRRPARTVAIRTFALLALSGFAGFVLYYFVLYLTLDYQAVAVARQALFAHREVTTVEAARSYWKWVLVGPLEFSVFAGLPLVVTATWGAADIRRNADLRSLSTFLTASLLTLVLLDLSGTVRGEVGRIWLLLMWPLAMAAAPALDGPSRNRVFAAVVALQLLQVFLMRTRITLYSVL